MGNHHFCIRLDRQPWKACLRSFSAAVGSKEIRQNTHRGKVTDLDAYSVGKSFLHSDSILTLNVQALHPDAHFVYT